MGKLFSKAQKKSCAWCEHGVKSEYTNEIFCKKKGVISIDDVCRKYKYDVLKRTPEVITISKDFTADDFSL